MMQLSCAPLSHGQSLTPARRYMMPMPSCFLYGDADEFRESFNAHTLFQCAAVVSYKGGHSFPRTLSHDGYQTLKAFVRGQYLRLLGPGFQEPADDVYGGAEQPRPPAAKM